MSKIITRPKLPPKDGYVEVINEAGDHVYEKTPETMRADQKQLESDDQMRLKDAQIQALTEQKEFMEDCIAEMATVLYV